MKRHGIPRREQLHPWQRSTQLGGVILLAAGLASLSIETARLASSLGTVSNESYIDDWAIIALGTGAGLAGAVKLSRARRQLEDNGGALTEVKLSDDTAENCLQYCPRVYTDLGLAGISAKQLRDVNRCRQQLQLSGSFTELQYMESAVERIAQCEHGPILDPQAPEESICPIV